MKFSFSRSKFKAKGEYATLQENVTVKLTKFAASKNHGVFYVIQFPGVSLHYDSETFSAIVDDVEKRLGQIQNFL